MQNMQSINREVNKANSVFRVIMQVLFMEITFLACQYYRISKHSYINKTIRYVLIHLLTRFSCQSYTQLVQNGPNILAVCEFGGPQKTASLCSILSTTSPVIDAEMFPRVSFVEKIIIFALLSPPLLLLLASDAHSRWATVSRPAAANMRIVSPYWLS